MDVVHRNFDGIDIAFQGHIPPEMVTILEEGKAKAADRKKEVLVEYNGLEMHVAETGARGGYAFRCDTGPEGETWFFKKPSGGDRWGIRVSVKSLPLALYGLGGVRARLDQFLETLGLPNAMRLASIGRVDYAIDVLLPGFTLEPENFVMHSHTIRSTHREAVDVMEHGRSGRVSSVTIGKMPGRQVIIYDKRAEVIAKHKVEWWEIWNAARRKEGKPELNPSERDTSQVWRVEFRAGKTYLKERWGIADWQSLDNKLGDLLERAASEIRYAIPLNDSNRARWPNDPLWDRVQQEITGDLFEMCSGAEPGVVKEIMRKAHVTMLQKQIIGLAATISHLEGLPNEEAHSVAQLVEAEISRTIEDDAEAFQAKRRRAGERYCFLG